MKLLFAAFLLSFNISIQGQKLKENLQGNWLCTNILDSKGNKTSGKFGSSDDYLKFSFEKGNLTIVEAPFDKGIKMPIMFGKDYIDLFPNAVYELPERQYQILTQTADSIILSTKNENGEPIMYYFRNQNSIIKDANMNAQMLDLGPILIKHLKVKHPDGFNRVSSYSISNNIGNLIPSPVFEDASSATFADYVSINFKFPDDFQFDKISNELIVSFNVTKEGATNIKIEKGLNEKVNSSLIKIIEKSNKKWTPAIVNGKPIDSKLNLHFTFYLGNLN